MRLLAVLLAVPLLAAAGAPGAPAEPAAAEAQLHVVATAHLDTQWRWTVRDTIDDFLPDTLRGSFALFEKYPGYVFTFEGAFHYALMKEYYPAEFERLKEYVKAGRWKVAGSWWNAVDTHVPSPESLVRQTLYGNGFFRRELGATSRDVYLPDCFGFSYALPSVAAHCGLTAFSTQKLTWGAAMKTPFDVGLWQGVDGSELLASLNPGDYASELKGDLTLDPDVYAVIDRQQALSGQPVAMKYFGTGDVGIPPLEPSVAWLQKSLTGPGPLEVRSVAPDQLARDLAARLTPAERARLPRYRGELLLTSHGAGCYTSQAAMKSLNRRNETLAFAAEGAAVAAEALGGAAYPRETLREAWTRFLWHQFHDDITGTSIPEAYPISWNDETLAAGTFADVLTSSVGAIARGLDTRAEGVPLVVWNPLALEREDLVEATVRFPLAAPARVKVTGPDGRALPAQLLSREGASARIAFVAKVAPVSLTAFSVAPAASPVAAGETKASATGLENARLRARLDVDGNVVSLFDKALGRELLSAPLTLQLFHDEPRKWSAWEVEYSALSAPPREVVHGPARVRVVEQGPARAAVEVVRQAAGSTFTQTLRLAAGGAGDRLEVVTEVDWRTKGTLLKAAFPLAASAPLATYDLGLGVATRGTNRPNAYEVPAQRWADVTDATGAFGVAVLNDSRHGWDRPDERTLRLSLVHTPRVVPSWDWLEDQGSNDLGRHRVVTALAPHAGDVRAGRVPDAAERLNAPLLAFQAPAHEGALGKAFSFLRLEGGDSAPHVSLKALKRAEESGEVVVRLQETAGLPSGRVTLRFARPVVAVRELNGAEEAEEAGTGGFLPAARPAPPELADGAVALSFEPFRPRTLALTLAPEAAPLGLPSAVPLALPFDLDGISRDEARTDGDFDGRGRSLAGELLPEAFESGGIPFRTGPQAPGAKNVVVPRGQRLELPPGDFDRLYLVAAAVGGDREVRFAVDGAPVTLVVPDWAEPVGQWNNRLVGGTRVDDPEGIAPAYEKETPVAKVLTHRHGARGENEAYTLSHLFRLRVDLPKGTRSVTLPDDARLRVLAATAARNPNDAVVPARRFLEPGEATVVHFETPGRTFVGRTEVVLTSPTPGATIRYTLDGTVPSPASTVYAGPIVLEKTTTVRARAFAPRKEDRFVAAATFTAATPRAASSVDPKTLSPGLACRLYEGEWRRRLPDFSKLTAARSFVLPTVGLTPEMPKERFGLVCEGYLSVPADGLTTFSLRAEDAAELLVDGASVVKNEPTDVLSRAGTAALAAGLHPVEVRYFQRDFVSALALRMDAPGEPLLPVPAERLFHAEAERGRP